MRSPENAVAHHLPLHIWLGFLTVVSVNYLSFLSYVKILQGKVFDS